MNEDDIQDRLKVHLSTALNSCQGREWFVISAVGSMNYNLFDDSSDVDSKLLVFPCLDDICGMDRVSRTIPIGNGEYCDCKDVREYFRIMKKANINFLEILTSDYYIVNLAYEDYWNELRAHTEEICHGMADKIVSTSLGMMRQKRKRLFDGTKTTQSKVDAYGYDSKQLLHIRRLHRFIQSYIVRSQEFAESIWIPDEVRNIFLNLKNYNERYLKFEVEQWADAYIEDAMDIYSTYSPEMRIMVRNSHSDFLDCMLRDLMVKIF